MIIKQNKNYKTLSNLSIRSLEKHLQNVVNVCFDYISIFTFNYSLNIFKFIPFYNSNTSINGVSNFTYLINLYFEKDNFMSTLFSFTTLKAKLTLNQLFQILTVKGVSSVSGKDIHLLSNLYYGLTLKDFIYSSFSARNSIIDSSLNTAESGYLTRKLIEGLRDVHIKSNFCGTFYECLDKIKRTYINVPFLCLNNKSICLKCIYIDYKSILISGYSKGTLSAQALGEPSTQMLLRTFHLGDKTALKNVLKTYIKSKKYINALFTDYNINILHSYLYKINSSKIIKSKLNYIYLYKTNLIEQCYITSLLFNFINCTKTIHNSWCTINVHNIYYKFLNKTVTSTPHIKYFLV
ncbi:DNA-directed RNA polymerase (apicoplast) [Babesia ovis]|uniref:DNA-directed RNA polymerase n=1 Tax=Babesia ovis TaxID=5869 RepID=A0A9W5TEV9_BABOV|nr:DNA-directed RNA polymerase [Babesia ovis]